MNMPVYFIPHGGGPCFFMEWTMGPPETWNKTAEFLRKIPEELPAKPSAILVITAHWEKLDFHISSGKNPELIYDYFGFPEETYHLKYPAPGNPELAEQISDLINQSGLICKKDFDRGFDHGVFIPLKVAFPEADIPVVALSLKAGLDPETHIRLGHILKRLRAENILIIGSGMSYHNMEGFLSSNSLQHSIEFHKWLDYVVSQNEQERNSLLKNWKKAPFALECHPREEHLIPLMVCSGAGTGTSGETVFQDIVMGVKISAYKF